MLWLLTLTIVDFVYIPIHSLTLDTCVRWSTLLLLSLILNYGEWELSAVLYLFDCSCHKNHFNISGFRGVYTIFCCYCYFFLFIYFFLGGGGGFGRSFWIAKQNNLSNRKMNIFRLCMKKQKNELCCSEERKKVKIRNRYSQVPGLHMKKRQKHKTNSLTWETRVQPFPSRWPQGCKAQTRQYHRQTRNTNSKNDLEKKHSFGTVQISLDIKP